MKILFGLLATAFFACPALAQTAPAVTCAGADMIAALAPAQRAALDAAVAAQPYPSGNLWRATKGDTTITLVGTFHIFDARMPDKVEKLRPLLRSADALMLEATDKEFAELQAAISTRPELMFSQGATLPERLSAQEWSDLSAQMSARNVPAFIASKMQPWYVSVLLGMPPCAMDTVQKGSTGLDALLSAAAREEGIPMFALEPYDTIFTAFGEIPLEDQLDFVRAALPVADEAEDMLATMQASYFREEHRQIWEFSRMKALDEVGEKRAKAERDFARMEEVIVSSRNRNWIRVINSVAPGKTIMVAAGAGHLSGTEGLLRLLEGEGYILTRLPF